MTKQHNNTCETQRTSDEQHRKLIKKSERMLSDLQQIIDERSAMNLQPGDWLMSPAAILVEQKKLLQVRMRYLDARTDLMREVNDLERFIDELHSYLY